MFVFVRSISRRYLFVSDRSKWDIVHMIDKPNDIDWRPLLLAVVIDLDQIVVVHLFDLMLVVVVVGVVVVVVIIVIH